MARAGLRLTFYVDALSFLASAVAISRIRIVEGVSASRGRRLFRKVGRDLVEGLQYLYHSRDLRFLVVGLLVLMGASGMGYVLLTVFVTKELGLGAPGLSVLAAILAVGMITGSLVYGEKGSRLPKDKVICAAALVAGACILGLGSSRSFFLIGAGVSIIGLTGGVILVAAYTWAQELTPDRVRGRVLAVGDLMVTGSFVGCSWLAGELGQRCPFSAIFLGMGAVLVAYAGLAYFLRAGGRSA